ncbi:hypothetical protein ASZ78_013190 [Callipepla squamata]|uniref:Uncharacterized protein n=2 Tax=Callipepla squamata TaxID=9009 RepID=A0A226MRG4_CALSU|nr:hypothetical protein ASZ78_013190 [Callipepla squamata]
MMKEAAQQHCAVGHWRRRCKLDNSSKQESSPGKEEDDGNEVEEDSDSSEKCDLYRVWADSTQWPVLCMVDNGQPLEKLVDNLLWAC